MTTLQDLLPGKTILYAIRTRIEGGLLGPMAYVGRGALCEYPGDAFVSLSEEYMRMVMEEIGIDGEIEVMVTDGEKDKSLCQMAYKSRLDWNLFSNIKVSDTRHKDKRCPKLSEQAMVKEQDPDTGEIDLVDGDHYKMLTIRDLDMFNPPDQGWGLLAPADRCTGPVWVSYDGDEWAEPKSLRNQINFPTFPES